MKMYTAQEMRVRADYLEGALADKKTAAMLRQAADMMDSVKRLIADRDNWRRQALDEDARANAATIKESLTVGNAAAMRDALVKADAAFRRITKSAWFFEANFAETKEVMDAGNAIESALSALPRNCDIGTSE